MESLKEERDGYPPSLICLPRGELFPSPRAKCHPKGTQVSTLRYLLSLRHLRTEGPQGFVVVKGGVSGAGSGRRTFKQGWHGSG